MQAFLSFRKTTLKPILLTLGIALSCGQVTAQYSSVPVTGFNSDQVANGVGNPTTSTTAALDSGVDGGAFVFIDGTYQFNAGCTLPAGNFLPANNQISSVAAPGLIYDLQPYNGPNALRIPQMPVGVGTGTLTLQTPTPMARLYLLGLAGGGAITGGITVVATFTDATKDTLLLNASAADWCSGSSSGATTVIPGQYARVEATSVSGCGGIANCQYFYEMSLPLKGINWGRPVASVTVIKTTTTNVFNVFALGMQSSCAAPIDQATSLTQGTTTISSIAASFTPATSAPTGYLVVRYPIGTTPTAPVDGTTYNTVGAALGAGTIVQTGAGTSFNATGLAGGSAYDFYVYAYNTGTTCGGPVYNTTTPLVSSFFTSPCSGGLFGTYTVGPNGVPYTTLTAALADINTFGVSGPVILELESIYTSAGETFPLTLAGNACISAANSVTIRPQTGATALTIENTTATPTIDIASGSFFTIDGRPGGLGITPELTIRNTSVTGIAVRFVNDAMFNRVTYCNLQGVNTSATGGVVQFGTTTGTNGNDGNAITFCNISGTSSSATPATLVYSSGSIGTTAQYNNNDTVANCKLFDFFSSTGESNAFKLGGSSAGSSAWALLDNSIYQPTARTGLTVAAIQYAFNLNSPLGGGFVISGNYIGGSAPQCGGSAWTTAGSGNFRFLGAYLAQLSGGAANTISNNTFANFDWTNSSATANGAPGGWAAIQVIGGPWAVTGNTIGSTTGNSITLTTAAASPLWRVIQAGRPSCTMATESALESSGISMRLTASSSSKPTAIRICKVAVRLLIKAIAADG